MKALLWRLKEQVARDRLSIVAAGVAFYMLLAVFPLLAALISLYGLMFDPRDVTEQLAALEGLVPGQAIDVLLGQFDDLKRTGGTGLGLGLAGGLLVALWSASAGTKAIMEALNVAYDEREKRGFIRRSAVALALTLGAIAGAILAIGLVVILPAGLRLLGLGSAGVISYARWPFLAVAAVFAFIILYRYGPSRDPGSFGSVGWGAVVATALWIGISVLFSWYVSSFGNYNKTYGAVSAIVVLLLWFVLSAYALLIGAELNADFERQGSRGRTAGQAHRA